MRHTIIGPALPLATLLACSGGEGDTRATESTVSATVGPTSASTSSAASSGASDSTTVGGGTSDATATATASQTTSVSGTSGSTGETAATTGGGCGACDEPNQTCVDDQCVTSCQGQDPDPCAPTQVCDVISGQCVDAGASCSLSGASEPCDGASCGPGTVCDGAGTCIPVSPCSEVECTSEDQCWGKSCPCDRAPSCQEADGALLNGPFSTNISGLDFDDECDAWAVTISGGQEFVRRMSPDGTLTEWGAIGDYDLGEVRVLRKLTILQAKAVPGLTSKPTPPAVEGLGEVALTYICCPNCGDCANNPEARGVARLDEDNVNMPLPIVIYAEPTQGTGPFGQMHLDGGPQGLTWGEDRVLYVGNTTANGAYSTADLEAQTVDLVYQFATRVTASAPVSAVHILVAVLGGQLYLFNTETLTAELVVDLMQDVTSLTHDAFNGDVYASLADLEVVRVRPFSGEVEAFATASGPGRVAVSPSGRLWFTPVKFLQDGLLSSWDLPATL